MKWALAVLIVSLSTGCSTSTESKENADAPISYYVSTNGSDENPGTKEKPFHSIQKINALQLHPGDQLLFHAGDVFQGKLAVNAYGTEKDPIIITSYGDDTAHATIDGGNAEAINIRGSYFQLRNIHAKGAGRKSGNTTNGITIAEAHNATVENLTTEGFQKSGIELRGCTNTVIRKIVAVNNGFCGIYVTGTSQRRTKNIEIRDCRADNNPGDPTILDNHSGNGILVGIADSVLIDHCTATNNGWDMPRIGNGPVGIWAYESNAVTIQYCISYKNKTSKGGKDGGGFDLDGGVTHSTIQYCLSYDNEGAGYGLFQYSGASFWHDNIVRYCVSINDAATTAGSGGIFVWNGAEDSAQLASCFVYNNVVFATHVPAVQFEDKSHNQKFYFVNNIFIGTGSVVHGPTSGEKFINNTWWTAAAPISFRQFASLAQWSAATGQEQWEGQMVGKQIDPQLAGPFLTTLTDPYQLSTLTGYFLQPSSSLKNTGFDMQQVFSTPAVVTDFFGHPVKSGSNPEPGIFEIGE